MLHPEYIKDMQSSYLLLKGMEGSTLGYGSKMLLYNHIPGLLKVEIRCYDELNVYYYDISGKINIFENFDKLSLKLEDIKNIVNNIINILEGSLEYLLYENDYIIEPEYIFIDPNTKKIFLCHLVGYQVNVQTQISSFIEYLMNKVDYKDEKAVMLVYSLYKESREANCTYEKLLYELNKKVGDDKDIRIDVKGDKDEIANSIHGTQSITLEEDISNYDSMLKRDKDKGNVTRKAFSSELFKKDIFGNGISRKEVPMKKSPRKRGVKNLVHQQKESVINKSTTQHYLHLLPEAIGEEEAMCYSKKTYLLATTSVVTGGILFIIALMSELLHNTFKTQLEPIKVICFLVILGSIEIYILCKLFQDNNKITKMISTVKFEGDNQYESNSGNDSKNQRDCNEIYLHNVIEEGIDSNYEKEISSKDIEDNDKTVNLYEDKDMDIVSDATEALVSFEPKTLLKPLDKDNYKYINLSSFPFLVGKNKKVVNHYFHNNTISRIHSRFEKKGDDIYLVDLNSLNGTFINGDRLAGNQPYKISKGDKISFAHISYMVQVE